jgi:hypothetical protein
MIPILVDDIYRKYDDNREVCLPNKKGRAEYKRRRNAMAARQGWRCGTCQNPMRETQGYFNSATFQHDDGRGMGGARQDDRIEDERGSWLNSCLCYQCNVKAGSVRAK